MKTYLFISVLFLYTACSKPQPKNEPLASVEQVDIIEIDSVKGKKNPYVVTEEIFWLFPEERESHFDKAKQRFDQKEFKSAAAEINKARLYLSLEIDKSEDVQKEELKKLQDKLSDMSQRLESGKNVTSEELSKAFQETNMALYRVYIEHENRTRWDYDIERDAVSLYLSNAVRNLENAEKWSKEKLSAEDKKTIAEGKSLSQKIKESLKKDQDILEKEWKVIIDKLKKINYSSNGTVLN